MNLTTTMQVVPYLVRLFVKAQMEYRGAFVLDRFAQIVNYGAAYAAIWVLLERFDTLGGWTWSQLAAPEFPTARLCARRLVQLHAVPRDAEPRPQWHAGSAAG